MTRYSSIHDVKYVRHVSCNFAHAKRRRRNCVVRRPSHKVIMLTVVQITKVNRLIH